jgi:hypothetical protein
MAAERLSRHLSRQFLPLYSSDLAMSSSGARDESLAGAISHTMTTQAYGRLVIQT